MIADEDDVWLLQEVNKDDTNRRLCTTDLTHCVQHGMFHDRCVVYVCLKNLTFKMFILAHI